MSDTPETDEAFERWKQGKINIFDEMARLERERNNFKKELVAANRGAETNAKINNSLMDKLIAMRNERDEAREALREIDAADWRTSGELRGMAKRALEAAK